MMIRRCIAAASLIPSRSLVPASVGAEPFADPPVVTAEAWVIADGETGKVLHSANLDAPSKTATLTKLMGARVVMSLAEKDPAVLDETIVFSKLADAFAGSTTEITAGESVAVGLVDETVRRGVSRRRLERPEFACNLDLPSPYQLFRRPRSSTDRTRVS